MKKLLILLIVLTGTTSAFAQSAGDTSMPKSKMHPAAKTVYTCSMHPEVTSDKPGKCPKCGMDLVKKKSMAKNSSMKGMKMEGSMKHMKMDSTKH